MDGQLCRPRMQGMSGAKVNERDSEQRRTHRRKHSRGFLLLPAIALQGKRYQGNTSKAREANNNQEQGLALVVLARISELPQVHGNCQEAERIAYSDNWTKLVTKRKIKENCREHAQ